MDRERIRVDSGDSINSQKLVHPLSVFHSKQDSDASIYTQGSRTSVQPQTGFGRRSRLEDVEEIPKEQSARSSLVAAAGSLRSSPSLPASSLRSSPSIGAATLRSRSNSNATTLEGGVGTRSRSNSTHHRPPPLALANSNVARADSKSNTVSASSTAPTTTATASSTNRDSSTSTSSNNSTSVLTTGSPLLHATWGSPLSSPSSSMGAGTTAGLGSAVGAGGFGFVTSPTGSSFRGAASAMRQMIEESQKSPTAVPGGYSLVHHATKIPEGEGARSLDMSVDSSFAKGTNERGIVMDDDEELPSHVRVDDSYTTADDSNTTLLYDSSPPRVRVNQQEGQEKRSSAEDDEEGQELDVDDIPILPATPISAAAPPLPPSASNSTLVPPSSSTDVVPPASPSQPSHLRPSLRDLREGGTVRVPGTMERRSLFLPHPNAPKTPKDLGGEESPGPMYVRDRGTPPGSATGEGEMSSASPPNPSSHGTPPPPNSTNQPLHNPQFGPPQPGNYPYQHQPPPPHVMMPPRPTARQIIIQSLTRPPPPMPPPIGPPGAQRRLMPRGPTIYGRIEGDFTTAMGPIPITWSVDPPPTKARIVPQAQMQGPGMGGPGMGMGPAMNAPGIHFGGAPGVPGVPGGSPGGGTHQPLPGVNPVTTHPPARSSPLRSGSTALPTEDLSNGLGKRPSVVSLRERTISSSPLATSVELPKEDANANSVAPGGGAPIPRANFFPKVGAVGARPRSRSFSGVSANEENEILPGGRGIKKTNSLVAPAPANANGKGAPHRPSPLSLPQNNVTTGPPSNPSSATPTTTTHKLRPQISTPNFKPPSSPLARDVTFGSRASPVPPPSPKRTTSQDRVPLSPRKMSFGLGKPTSPPTTLETIPSGQVPNATRVMSPDSTRSTASPPPTGPTGVVPGVGLHLRRLTSSRSAVNLRDRSDSNSSWEEAAGFRPPSTSSTTSISRPIPIPRSTLSPPPTFQTLGGSTNSSPHGSLRLDTNFSLGMASGETTSSPVGSNAPQSPPDDTASIRSGIHGSDSRSQMVTSPSSFVTAQTHLNHGQPTSPVQRSNSLKNKLSLPNLRRNRSRAEDDANVNEFLLQVHDTDFEFVRPALGHFAAARGSEDSGVLGREAALESAGSTVTGSGGSTTFLRGESPAMSMFSNRSPTTEANGGWSNPKSSLSLPPRTGSPTSPVTPDTATIEAHRNREQKWMSLLGSSPASQARKSKKVRKLLLEGVPASVRYLVWNHLTDGKGKALPSVYPQLCKRGPVPLSDRIEADVETSVWFLDEKQSQLQTLREAGGGIVQLLEAYLNMVPDIQYSPGLPHIVGQLLLVAPEEDAFWIFVSIMDTHIRPYFASGSAQMDVDASLFKTALEANDPQLAKKLFVDMGILPVSICQPWFSSLFVGCLPDDYLARTWDIFLYEGVPFLLRVGLALTSFVRRQLLECTSEEAVLSMLHRPPLTRLPPNTENYLTSALNVKLKDDDIKKQRVKLEAQVKRQTQQQAPRSAGSISLPRT
ncbi:rab-GTPase-TBC domain-containing protein [Coprinopsis sp. MPI-PUGE-AT-0042]|nr:rab-GTPase-TBC domain-containing protein [Coprinopsis sp. MPI-PUGE-AT-0042]